MFTHEGDAEVSHHIIQRRSSWPGVLPNERVLIPQEECQPRCRDVHGGQPAHTQRMVQLPEVHPRTVQPTERSPRAQNPDAKGQGTRDTAVQLRHVEPATVLLRHATPYPPHLPGSLHRLAKEQSHRSPDFLSEHPYQDGKGEHRGDYGQEADSVRGICGAHGGHETSEVRDVRRTGGGRGLRRGHGKE